MAFPYSLNNTFRMWDQVLYEWLDGLKCDYGVLAGVPRKNFGILRVFATPKRATAEMEQVLIRKEWLPEIDTDQGDGSGSAPVTGLTGAETYKRIPLPFVSIYRQAPIVDPNRFIRGDVSGLNPSDRFETVETHRYPTPINIPYQLDFWMRKKFSEAHIYEWLLSQIGRKGAGHSEIMLQVTPLDSNNKTPWGTKIVPLNIEAFADNSEIEPQDTERVLRFTVDLILKAWQFHVPSIDKTPLTLITEFVVRDQSSGERFIFDINLLTPDAWTLENVSGNSELEVLDGVVVFLATDLADGIISYGIPVVTDTYEIKVEYKARSSATIEVFDKDDVLLHTVSLPISYKDEFVSSTFANPSTNTKVKLVVRSDNNLVFNHFIFRRVTYNP